MPDLADALAVAARGLAVFPLPPGGRQPAPGWQARCTSDPDVVRRMWTPGDNIGVGCRASNLVGVDLDRHSATDVDGIAAFTALYTARREPWPLTLTVRTPHGLHLYFRPPPGRTVASTSSRVAAGVDIRGPGRRSGGYLIGPGSVVDGVRYVVELDADIAPLPAWLADLLS